MILSKLNYKLIDPNLNDNHVLDYCIIILLFPMFLLQVDVGPCRKIYF